MGAFTFLLAALHTGTDTRLLHLKYFQITMGAKYNHYFLHFVASYFFRIVNLAGNKLGHL